MDAYNVLDSKRPDVIATAYEAAHTGGHDNSNIFSDNIVSGHETKVKVRKRPDCTTTVRRAIASVDDITLRCNHSTSHVNGSVGAARH